MTPKLTLLDKDEQTEERIDLAQGTTEELDAKVNAMFKENTDTALIRVERDGNDTQTNTSSRIYTINGKDYRQLKILGNTKSGHTFLIEDAEGNKEVLKLLSYRHPPGNNLSEQVKAIQHFDTEVDVLSKLNHPQIAQVRSNFTIDNHGETSFYFTQEYFQGLNLEELVREEGPLPAKKAVETILSLLHPLEYCHQQGIIHRDIKPANVIWNGQEESKLVDFGVVVEGKVSTVGSSTIAGTPGYMAPEQWWGRATEKSDIYGIGTTLLHILTGKEPEKMIDHSATDFNEKFRINYQQYVQHLDKNLQEILGNCLSLKEEQRYSSVSQLRKALQDYLEKDDIKRSERERVHRPVFTREGIKRSQEEHQQRIQKREKQYENFVPKRRWSERSIGIAMTATIFLGLAGGAYGISHTHTYEPGFEFAVIEDGQELRLDEGERGLHFHSGNTYDYSRRSSKIAVDIYLLDRDENNANQFRFPIKATAAYRIVDAMAVHRKYGREEESDQIRAGNNLKNEIRKSIDSYVDKVFLQFDVFNLEEPKGDLEELGLQPNTPGYLIRQLFEKDYPPEMIILQKVTLHKGKPELVSYRKQ